MSNVIDLFTRKPIVIECTTNSNGVFDRAKERIEARFGDNGVPKHITRAWSKRSLEPYAYGCTHNITWRTKTSRFWNKPSPFPMDIQIHGNDEVGRSVSKGGTDPLMWMDMTYRITHEFIKAKHGYPLKIHTRSDLVAHEDYVNVLDKYNHMIYIYTNDLTEEECRQLEPGAPSNKRRYKAYLRLKELGFNALLIKQKLKSKRKVA